LFRVIGVADENTITSLDVVAFTLSVHGPFLYAAVLKLSGID
jgi:hypothetical protein